MLCLRYIGRAPTAAAGSANHVFVTALDENRNICLTLDTGWCARGYSTQAQLMSLIFLVSLIFITQYYVDT